jgi:hypothetical protein
MAPLERLDRMTVSSIETFFDTLLRGDDKLTKNLFFGELPTDIGKDWTKFAVVDCGNPIRDDDAYGSGTVRVILYTKQNAKGIKDVKTLQEMEKALNRIVRESSDPYYHISFRGRYSSYNAINDYFFVLIQLNLVIT